MGFWGTPVRLEVSSTDPIDTDKSTSDTIHRMIAIANSSANTPLIASVVNSCLMSLPSHSSKRDIARAIWWWVKGHVTFCEDEEILAKELGYEQDPNQELLIPPVTLLAMPVPMGDCDDFSILTASLLKCAQIPCWFVTIAVDEIEPWRFSHVFVSCWLDDEGQRMTMDCSHGTIPGWETKRQQFRRVEWLVA